MSDRFDFDEFFNNNDKNDKLEDIFSSSNSDLNSFYEENDDDVKMYSPTRKSDENKATTSSSNGRKYAKRKPQSSNNRGARKTPRNDDYIDNDMQLPEEKKRSFGKKMAGKIGKAILSVFLICVITGCIVAGAFVVYVFTCVDDTIAFDLNKYKQNGSSVIYVQDPDYTGTPDVTTGDGWIEYQTLSNEKHEWVSIDNVSMNVINAYVACEDQDFYEHKGVNWKRTFGAFVNLFIKIYDSEQGGSTITQQLVKNITDDDDRDAMRKIREIMRARKLETLYSKDTIMECYLNEIYLGNNCYGIQAASKYYFGKTASELTVTEAACIAAITKSPTYYNPIAYPEENKNRRNWILRQEKELGKITEEEYNQAINEELDIVGNSSANGSGKKDVYSYFTDAVIEDVIADLMDEYGYAYSYAENIVLNGGLNIYSTCNPEIQSIMEEEFLDEENFAVVYGTEQKAQAAMTVMDYSGHVVGIVGGRGEKGDSRTLNRAWSSARQPGSTMKPMGVYALGIENNVITYSTKISNSALKIGSVSFKNYSGNTTPPVTVQKAVEVSYNLPPIRILQKIGFHNSFVFCKEKIGLTHLVEGTDENANLAVGGLTYGVTATEETAAYAIFGNGGTYYEPTTYYQVTDLENEIVLNYDDVEPIQAISKQSATIMNRILRTVVTGGGGTARSAYIDGFTVIAKTGTTSDNKDRWFCGGTPNYISAVWFGCDEPYAMNSLSTSTNPAIIIWRSVMRRIHSELDVDSDKKFVMSDEIRTASYCAVSGKICGSKCESGGTGYYKSNYMPVCNGGSDHTIADVAEKDMESSSEVSSDESSSEDTSSDKSSKKPSSKDSSSKKTSSKNTSSKNTSIDTSDNTSVVTSVESESPDVSEEPVIEVPEPQSSLNTSSSQVSSRTVSSEDSTPETSSQPNIELE